MGVGAFDLELYPRANPKIPGKEARSRSGPAPYGRYNAYLVRTALVRSPEFRKDKGPKIKTAEDVAKIIRGLGRSDQEVSLVIALDFQRRLIAIHETAIGGTRRVSQSMRHIVKVPFLAGASYVYIAHNHPSGSSRPSKKDAAKARRVREALACVGLPLMDSVIVAGNRYTSLRQEGLLPPPPKRTLP